MENFSLKEQSKYFMFAYMYELEIFLSSIKNEIQSVTFQSDEANTDRPLKEFLKSVIEKRFNRLPSSEIKKLILNGSQNCFDIEYKHFSSLFINCVYLPDQLTENIKSIIRNEKTNAVYTNPDMCFEITDGSNIVYQTVELKSTKNDSIPGSSIQQILADEWVIFIKHTDRDISITTGQYINAINAKMQFPDRSPRPQVSFNEVVGWNNIHRHREGNHLRFSKDSNEHLKYQLIKDWQNYLALRWLDVIFSDNIKNNEPWFNNNLRKFILLFINKYESLTFEEQQSLKDMLPRIIT